MNMKMKVIYFLWLVFCLAHPLSAQKGFVSSGGDIHYPNGTVAYSIGQVAFEPFTHEAGNINPGLQQPFQLSIVGINGLDWHSRLLLYPNPADQNIYLQFSSDEITIQAKEFFARVYDMQGNLLFTQRLKDEVNKISISALPAAMYFIQIWQANRFIRSVSFSKTN